MRRRKRRSKKREEVISFILALTIAISPIFHLLKNKGSKVETPNPDSSISGDRDFNIGNKDDSLNIEIGDDFKELALETRSVYNFDLSLIDIPYIYENNSCSINFDLDVSDATDIYNEATRLVDQIRNNSWYYLLNHHYFTSAFFEDVNDKHYLDKIATQVILKDIISDILKRGFEKDICLIENLKFVICYDKNFVSNGDFVKYYSDDHVLVVFPNNVRSSVGRDGYDVWEALASAIMHEFNVIRMQNCKCQLEDSVFPYKMLTEISLLSELYSYDKIDTLNNSNIKYESFVLLLGLFHDNLIISDYYKAVFGNDIESFYNFCNVSCDEDIYRLNKILYAIDKCSNLSDDDIGYDYRAEIFSMTIGNMICYTKENRDFKLEDNLVLFNIIKNMIVTGINYDSKDDSILNIQLLSDLYIRFLSNHYSVSIDKVNKMQYSEEVIYLSLVLVDICNRNESISNIDIEYRMKTDKILKRFPLLRQVIANYNFDSLDYGYWSYGYKSSNYVLTKKLD